MTQPHLCMTQPRVIFIHYPYLARIQYFVTADTAKLVEHWIDVLEIASSSPLYATIFFNNVACWHMSLQEETHNYND